MPIVRKIEPQDAAALGWEVEGVFPDEAPNEDEVYERARQEWAKTRDHEAKRAVQKLKFDQPYVMLAFVGDQHLGDPGTDVERCFAEAQLIAETPGMACITVGDALNQFVIGRLRQARDNVRLAICDEWALVRRYYRMLAPKLCASVGGNHDYWAVLLVGIDYFRDVLADVSPHALYDPHDLRVTLEVGGTAFPGRIRHQWQGRSIYNVTHSIERAQKWDQDFIWGVGGHTHESGVVRTFNVGGRNGLAALVGSYKRHDSFAKMIGFPRPNTSTGVAILFDAETGSMTGFDSLEVAAKVMRHLQRAGGSA